MLPQKNLLLFIFYFFVTSMHEMIVCRNPECDILIFLRPLKEVLLNEEKCNEEQRETFANHFIKNPNIFKSMFYWKKNRNHTTPLIQKLKILREAQEKTILGKQRIAEIANERKKVVHAAKTSGIRTRKNKKIRKKIKFSLL